MGTFRVPSSEIGFGVTSENRWNLADFTDFAREAAKASTDRKLSR